MMRSRPRRLLVVTLAAVVVLAGAGAARAYWTGSGDGSGSAATGTPVALTLTPGTAAETLYPGGSSDVALTVVNPGSADVRIGSLVLDTTQGTGGFAVDTAHGGCAVGALALDTQTNSGAGWSVPGRAGGVDGTLSITLSDAVRMGLGAANACQGARFTVYLRAGP